MLSLYFMFCFCILFREHFPMKCPQAQCLQLNPLGFALPYVLGMWCLLRQHRHSWKLQNIREGEIPSLQSSDLNQLFSLVTVILRCQVMSGFAWQDTLGTAGCVKVALALKDTVVFSWSLHRKAQGGHEEKQLFPSIKQWHDECGPAVTHTLVPWHTGELSPSKQWNV